MPYFTQPTPEVLTREKYAIGASSESRNWIALSLWHVWIRKVLTIIGICLLFPTYSSVAQDNGNPDSARIFAKDSIIASLGDSLLVRSDTILFKTKNSVDTLVSYVAKDSIVSDLNAKTMTLYRASKINYGNLGIEAERITLNWDKSTMTAKGIPDTTAGREGKMTGTPVFSEGGEKYYGVEMEYNFRTKRGVISQGETTIDNGIYLGERIKRMSDDVYFIGAGKYTTCDNPDHKHYFFGSPEMKVIPNDLIIAEPIIFYIEDIPLFAFPFAIIPGKSGRSSGIIPPTFGEDYYRGRYLRGGGYYFAASDYWDAKLTGDWYSKGGYKFDASVQYVLRYNFNGSVSASYGRQQFNIGNPYQMDDQPRMDYSIGITHNQQIDPTSRVDVNFNFLSNTYYSNYSNDFQELLNQSSRSHANYIKSWEGTNRSININITRDQDLRNGTSTTVLPEISFNQSQIFPFRKAGSYGEGAWYEMIGFDYSGRALNKLDVTLRRELSESGEMHDIKTLYDRRGVQHNLRLLSTPRFGYFSIQPSFSYAERWYDHRIERSYNPVDSVVDARDVRGFYALRTFQFGISANTKLYGTIMPNFAGILGIRHTLQPSLSYMYNPDFSKRGWGYYLSYCDSAQEVWYDPYTGYSYKPGEVFGGVGAGESQTLGMNVSNIFEMKIKPSEGDTTMTPRKFQLFNLNASTSYNFVKDSLKLSPISLGFRTNIQNLLDIYGGATFSAYVYERQLTFTDIKGNVILLSRGGEVDRFLINEGRGLARLTSFDLHLSTSISHEMFESRKSDTNEIVESRNTKTYSYRIPWNISLGYDYSMNQFNPDNKYKSSSMRVSLSISPTRNWRISASTYYDFNTKLVGAPQISVYRDLHCWEMNFSWVPTGFNRNFALIIRLKAPQLQDIKIEKKGSDRGVY